MSGVLIDYDHISLRNEFPKTRQEVPVVPRVGESVGVLGKTFVVYAVHWWEQPIEPGEPAARVVLRTPDEFRRARVLRSQRMGL